MKFIPSDIFFKLVSLLVCLMCAGSVHAIPEKPRGCRTYYCTDEDWEKGLKRFDPLTIRWPLHYDGSVVKDLTDGGRERIDVVFSDHKDNISRLSLSEFRRRPECPNSEYLKDGIPMGESFICKGSAENRPSWEMTACSMVEASMEELTLLGSGGSCGKKLRQWVVIDWCTYQPNGNVGSENSDDDYILLKDYDSGLAFYAFDDYSGAVQVDGYYMYTQLIKIIDNTAPKLLSCEEVIVEVTSGCEKSVILKNKAIDEGDCPSYRIEVTLEVYDDQGLLLKKIRFNTNNGEDFSQNIGVLPIGDYQVFWKIKDACGNYAHCSKALRLVDKTAPYLLCIQSLSTSLNHTDGLTIWAKDFVLKMDEPCDDEITISFDPESDLAQRHFDCIDGTGFHNLTIYATDSQGNRSSCDVELFISDRQVCIDSLSSIGGKITDRFGHPMSEVDVALSSSDIELASEYSDDFGQYFIRAVPDQKSNLFIRPNILESKDQGLDAHDLIRLSHHIFEIELFTDVLEYAAADINNDAKIDMEDYWSLAHLVFDIPFTIDQFRPWKFIDQKLYSSGQNRASKLTVPIQVFSNRSRYDILALKSGDVDFSWSKEIRAEARSAPIKLALKQYEDYSELDLGSIGLNGLTLWIEGETKESFIENNSDWLNGDIKFFYPMDGGLYVFLGDEELTSGQSSIVLKKSSKVLSEYSFGWVEDNGVALRSISIETFDARSVSDNDQVIFPNPFNESFTIQLRNGERFTSDIHVFDVTGQLLKSIVSANSDHQKIDLSDLSYRGILLLKYGINDEISTKKIVKQ